MPVATEKTASRLQVSVHVQAEVTAPEVARRQANVWLLEHVGNLLRAENPELILGEQLVWRVDVVLTRPDVGAVGRIGRLELGAVTGKVLSDVATAQELTANGRENLTQRRKDAETQRE